MVISDTYKFVFAHCGKTAGTSIEHMLIPYADPYADWYDSPQHKHLRAVEIRKRYFASGLRKWGEYFSFAFIRHPLDRMVSNYHYMKCMGAKFCDPAFDITKEDKRKHEWINSKITQYKRSETFRDWASHAVRNMAPQVEWFTRARQAQCVNYVGRFESIKQNMQYVCDTLGIQDANLPHHNKTEHEHWSTYFQGEDTLIRNAQQVFRHDFYFGGYEFVL